MKDQKVNKTAVVGVVGAAIGAAAVAAAVALNDEKTRKKLEKAVGDVKNQAKDYIEAQSDQVDQIDADQVKNKTQDALDDAVDKAQSKLDEAKKKAEK